MAFSLDNFVRSNLAVDAAAGDTSLVIALAAPPLRDPPAASESAPGIMILQDQPTAPTKIEIVTYTGVSIVGTQVTLTGVTRGLEGTAAQAWTTGTPTFAGNTAAVMASKANVADSVPISRKVNGKALSADVTLAAGDVGAVPTSRTVNGKALSGNVTLTASDVSALPDDTTFFSGAYADLTGKPTIPATAADVGAVPTSRTVNGKALAADIALGASDVGAAPAANYALIGTGNTVTFSWSSGALNMAVDSTGLGAIATGAWVSANFAPAAHRPQVFVQSSDPSIAAADGALWIW